MCELLRGLFGSILGKAGKRGVGIGILVLSLGVSLGYGGDLEVTIENSTKRAGKIYLSVFSEAEAGDFKKGGADEAYAAIIMKIASGGEVKFTLQGLAAGGYAFKYFLDEDGDGALALNKLGIPKEKVGFSRASPLPGVPSFKRAQIDVGAEGTTAIVRNLN